VARPLAEGTPGWRSRGMNIMATHSRIIPSDTD
jgi:hypothetical protein